MNRIVQIIALSAASVARAAETDPLAEHEVLRWNRLAMEVAAEGQTDPLTESRVFAMAQLAVHNALNAVDYRYEQYGRQLRVVAPADRDLAVATAAHRVLTFHFPAAYPKLTAALKETIARTPEGAAKHNGSQLGYTAAEVVIELRKDDGADRPVEYVPGTEPGAYRPTPPDFTPAAFAHWGAVKPFVLADAAQFRPEPPPAPGSARALADIAEVLAVGRDSSTTRTAEQSEIAKYWYENSTQGWNRVAREIVLEHGANEWDAARLFALVNLAMADGFIGGFEAKYHFDYWRPATAIRASDAANADWLNFLPTPPVPDHPSTHTVLGAAAATVLARVAGADETPFAMTSGAPYAGIRRSFTSFSEAAAENGDSRVYAGIHFRSAVTAGYTQGVRIGGYVVENALRPVAAARR